MTVITGSMQLGLMTLICLACWMSAALAIPPTGPGITDGIIATSESENIALKPLDDRINPYLGQYSEWDYWILANYKPDVSWDEMMFHSRWEMPPAPPTGFTDGGTAGAVIVLETLVAAGTQKPYVCTEHPAQTRAAAGQVDKDGYLIPFSKRHDLSTFSIERTIADLLSAKQFTEIANPAVYAIQALGEMSDEQASRYKRYPELVRAAQYPPIPAWLGENPPLSCMLVPNGEFVVTGPLGVPLPEQTERSWERSRSTDQVARYYRYSADGRLLGQTGLVRTHSCGWFNLYFDFDSVQQAYASNNTSYVTMGAVAYTRRSSHEASIQGEPADTESEFLGAVAWDGTPLGQDDLLPASGMIYLNPIWAWELQKIYRNQVELGITRPDSTSPYWGTADGPVLCDPDNPAIGAVASRWVESTEQWIEVRDPHSLENPYRGDYAPWDLFILDQRNKQNPLRQKWYNEQYKIQREKQIEAGKLEPGSPYPAYIVGNYKPGPDDHWRDFNAQVDAQGWLLPALEAKRQSLLQPLPPTGVESHYSFHSGGILPEEQLTVYDAVMLELKSEVYPELPDWLTANPVYSAICGPDGEWITRGALGSWAELMDLPEDEWRKEYPKLLLHRYSADGELLEVAGRFEQFWQRFYSAHVDGIIAAVNSSEGEFGAMPANGFIRKYKLDPACAGGT